MNTARRSSAIAAIDVAASANRGAPCLVDNDAIAGLGHPPQEVEDQAPGRLRFCLGDFQPARRREDVEGPGVVGQTPRLEPGQAFKYQSYCPLRTGWGTMEGTYQMRYDDGQEFEVVIGRFYLRVPKEEKS